MKTKINIRSFDMDGCIFNTKYLSLHSQNRLIEANEKLIEGISREIQQEQYDIVYCMLGSNRQSLRIEKINQRNGNSFGALFALCEELQKRVTPIKCHVDKYLLADTYGKVANGENCSKALKNSQSYQFADWLFDDSKLTIVYAQIHKIASENPSAEITYDFYDDRYLNKDILKGLADFFTANPDLVPHNLRIRFHHYAGADVTQVAEIAGKGKIDKNYQDHIHLMIHSAGISFHRDHEASQNVMRKLLANKNLDTFKKQRLLSIDNNDQEMKNASYTVADLFYKKQMTAVFNKPLQNAHQEAIQPKSIPQLSRSYGIFTSTGVGSVLGEIIIPEEKIKYIIKNADTFERQFGKDARCKTSADAAWERVEEQTFQYIKRMAHSNKNTFYFLLKGTEYVANIDNSKQTFQVILEPVKSAELRLNIS